MFKCSHMKVCSHVLYRLNLELQQMDLGCDTIECVPPISKIYGHQTVGFPILNMSWWALNHKSDNRRCEYCFSLKVIVCTKMDSILAARVISTGLLSPKFCSMFSTEEPLVESKMCRERYEHKEASVGIVHCEVAYLNTICGQFFWAQQPTCQNKMLPAF